MKLRFLFVSLLALGASQLHAQMYQVQALENSISGGVGASTVTLNAGDTLSVSVDPTDLWSAGSLPRWSNADGLTHNLFATGSDDSGQSSGTLIGEDFGEVTVDGFTAPFGALVGEIGTHFFLIGTSYSGTAPTSGVLDLFYWDSNHEDNTQFITADISVSSPVINSAVPEPSTYALFGAIALAALAARRSFKRRA